MRGERKSPLLDCKGCEGVGISGSQVYNLPESESGGKKRALAMAIRDAEQNGSELVLATNPDCDRVGIAVRDARWVRAS